MGSFKHLIGLSIIECLSLVVSALYKSLPCRRVASFNTWFSGFSWGFGGRVQKIYVFGDGGKVSNLLYSRCCLTI
jgi:hypothetical protein